MTKPEELIYFMILSRMKGVGAVKFNQIIKKNKKLKISIIEFFTDFSKGLFENYPFINESSRIGIKNYLSHWDEAKDMLLTLSDKDIKITTILDPAYPEKLIEGLDLAAPPILYSKGNLSLLNDPQIAVVGTRSPSKTGITLTQRVSQLMAKEKITVTSGYAKGVDQIAHNSSLSAGGKTILVLGYGIHHFSEAAIYFKKNIEDRRLVISEFYPSHPFHKGFLMTRNKTICALSDGILVVESKSDGGSYHAGKYGLMLKKPTYTFSFEDFSTTSSGNRNLIEQGATDILVKPDGLDSLDTSLRDLIGLIRFSGKTNIRTGDFPLFDNVEGTK